MKKQINTTSFVAPEAIEHILSKLPRYRALAITREFSPKLPTMPRMQAGRVPAHTFTGFKMRLSNWKNEFIKFDQTVKDEEVFATNDYL